MSFLETNGLNQKPIILVCTGITLQDKVGVLKILGNEGQSLKTSVG